MKKIQFAVVIIMVTYLVVSCNRITESFCEFYEPQKFSADVNPIIQNSCTNGSGCHGSGSANSPGPLITFDQIKNAASSIKTAVANKSMPKGSALTNTQIQSITCWVDNGAQHS